uniref:Poly [ADP-ribose] polymerase n=1 Tax=Panagrolaimus davidi TaxID=227884 RepID=A0A914PMY3_9BILA
MRPPKTIDTLDELKQELELLEFLSDIEAAVASLSIEVKNVETLHHLDKKYAQLKCDLQPLDKDHDRFKLVETYLLKTHTHAHNGYTMKLKNVYEIKKHGEDEKFKAEIGNRRLLWHGSRITNWHGILSSGLRIAPKEAPMTGYMFGKGVYFADASSKSANYCCARIGETGILVLSEVALGEMNQLTQACYNASKLPEGKFSTMGVGRFAPNHEQYITIDDDVVVPCGDMIEQDDGERKDLMFNEYIVYDTNQIKLRSISFKYLILECTEEENLYQCEGGQKCIPIDWLCDRAHDCPKGDDENHIKCGNKKDRGECEAFHFECIDPHSKKKKCIRFEWKCDGSIDCENGIDEANCEPPPTIPSPSIFESKNLSYFEKL